MEGKHNEWMFDGDSKFESLADVLDDFFKKYL